MVDLATLKVGDCVSTGNAKWAAENKALFNQAMDYSAQTGKMFEFCDKGPIGGDEKNGRDYRVKRIK